MRGLFPAIGSVLLVSFAQIAMKYAMISIPAGLSLTDTGQYLCRHLPATLMLFAGLAGYLFSMVCWFFALKHLPLSKAYALLSLSYIIVWGIALALGMQGDTFSVKTLAGILSVITGVMLIFLPGAENKPAG